MERDRSARVAGVYQIFTEIRTRSASTSTTTRTRDGASRSTLSSTRQTSNRRRHRSPPARRMTQTTPSSPRTAGASTSSPCFPTPSRSVERRATRRRSRGSTSPSWRPWPRGSPGSRFATAAGVASGSRRRKPSAGSRSDVGHERARVRGGFRIDCHADLPTGRIAVEVHASERAPEDLFGFAQRRNPKRAFLFVSRVLGRHVSGRSVRHAGDILGHGGEGRLRPARTGPSDGHGGNRRRARRGRPPGVASPLRASRRGLSPEHPASPRRPDSRPVLGRSQPRHRAPRPSARRPSPARHGPRRPVASFRGRRDHHRPDARQPTCGPRRGGPRACPQGRALDHHRLSGGSAGAAGPSRSRWRACSRAASPGRPRGRARSQHALDRPLRIAGHSPRSLPRLGRLGIDRHADGPTIPDVAPGERVLVLGTASTSGSRSY